MGIMLILAVGWILAFVVYLMSFKKCNDDGFLGWILRGIFGFLIGSCLAIITVSQATADLQCGKLQERKNAIEYRLEQIDTNDQNIMINGGIYDDIAEYNNDVRKYKTFRNSFWTNWFVSKGLDEFDYIEYDVDK